MSSEYAGSAVVSLTLSLCAVWSNVDGDGNEMCQRAEDDEDMPDLMKTKFAGEKVKRFCDVNNGPKGVDHAADYKPCQRADGQDSQHLANGGNAQPAHHYIHASGKPARRV